MAAMDGTPPDPRRDPLQGFHPAVADWFRRAFPGGATAVQSRAWREARAGRPALVCAPTGSGKTLAAFLAALDGLVVRGLAAPLPDAVQVLYVSPLKALSNDIEKNLQAPLNGIRDRLFELGLPDVGLRVGVRTGDSTTAERALMRRLPPHVLVTTPESLFILLTSPSGRAMLGDVRTVIVDELHALAGSKRGAHLMLSLERLAALSGRRPLRIGLSATVRPVDVVARYLVGAGDDGDCTVIDAGHARRRDLAVEVPGAPLDAVMSNEVWTEVYDRLAELARGHRTTLVFVNQRRLAERVARHLAERLGEGEVAAHHGSLARAQRLDAEQRLKSGRLRALVATSSLELGIDIGEVDLVCQLGSPRWISALLQRVGRSGHAVGGLPKGRLFPLSRDDLLECAALLRAIDEGVLDRLRDAGTPLDVLAQQVLAEVGCGEWRCDDLFAAVRRAAPYRSLARGEFDAVLAMLAEGYATRRGRRGAWLHLDGINGRVRPRRGARLVAVTNAGTIPDQFDYDVVLQPEGQRIGTLNEDFAFESVAGDIFQLGNSAYRILKVETGKVLVEDARGQPPSLPFWFGEALGRSDELSQAVSALSAEVDRALDEGPDAAAGLLARVPGLPVAAGGQLVDWLAAARAALGVLPTLDTLVVERFFDEVGDAHLVIHSPYGSRINKAWGLALRKRFCRTFNFELQASALEDSLILSLGPSHSFPLEDVTRFLHSASARDVLVQALLDAPMFGTRWRWCASVALAVRRMNAGRRVPPQFQRSDAEDLLTVVFPDQVACAENLSGPREVPDHPLVAQTLHDCLHDTMDLDGFLALLAGIESGRVRIECRDLVAPSPLAGAILNARPYAFLDDGEAEERRTRAVGWQALPDAATAATLARPDPAAVAKVREEAWPLVRDADELHDALMVHGALAEAEVQRLAAAAWLDELVATGRALPLAWPDGHRAACAVERWPQLGPALCGTGGEVVAGTAAPCDPEAADADPDTALVELLRGRLELLGPTTAAALAAPFALPEGRVEAALLRLEGEGVAMRGAFDAGLGPGQWCERRLLARIHRLSRDRRRASQKAVPPAQFQRFLLHWQGIAGAGEPRRGEAGLLAVLEQLEGWVAPACAWERDLLPQRLADWSPALLDRLCASGRIGWWRPRAPGAVPSGRGAPVRATPILLSARASLGHWQALAAGEPAAGQDPLAGLDGRARRVAETLRACGALFLDDLVAESGLILAEAETALAELVGQGLAGCDSFAGLRALLAPARHRARQRGRALPADAGHAGRWSLQRVRPAGAGEAGGGLAEPAVEHVARVLLRRYGVVFRALLAREQHLPPWRALHYVYRRMEARGELLGGRFVEGQAGEQFALAEAASALRGLAPGQGSLVALSAADPLNLSGVLGSGTRLPGLAGNRLLLRDGVPAGNRSGRRITLDPQLAQADLDRARRILAGSAGLRVRV